MKFKRLIPLLAGLALLVTGCYKDDITALQKQIDDLQFFSVKEQVDRIEATVKSLQQADFQKGIDAINASLTQKETALQNQITELQNQISGAAGSTDVEKLEAKLLGLEQQMTEVQNAIKILDDVDLTKTVDDLKALMENASKYEEDIATLKNQFAGLELEKKLAAIEAAYQTAIATSKEEMTKYFDDNFQTKFEELFGKTQSTIETWLTKSKDFQKLIKDFDSVQVVVKNQLEILGLRGSQIDSLKEMAEAVEYDIQKAIENAINTLKLGEIKTIGDDVETLKTDVNQLRTYVDELQKLPEKIGDFEQLQTTLVEAILALQEATMADDQTLKDLVLALKSCLLDANNSLISVKNLISDISANSKQIAINRDSVGINAADIKQLQEDLSKLPTTDVTEGLATRIAAIESGVIGEKYNLANIVTDITNITTALSDKNGLIAVENIVAQLNALQDQVGKSTDGADKNTIYGLIAGLDAKLGLIGNKTLKEYVDSTSGANKKALADSLVKVNDKLTALDSRIKAIDGDEVNSLVNRVKALETIVGTGTLNTTAKTLIGAINELVTALDNEKNANVTGSLKNLIVALQADLLTIEGGEDISTTNLYTLSNQITGLDNLLKKYEGITFGSKNGKEALDSVIVAVGKIQKTITDDLVTNTALTTTLENYYTKTEADGLFQIITEIKEIIGEGETPVEGTVLARIAVLEAATVKLTDDSEALSYDAAIKAVFDDLKAHKDLYHVTQTEITGIHNDITAINTLLGDAENLDDSFTAIDVIGALNELMAGLESTTGSLDNYLGEGALDSLITDTKLVKEMLTLQTSVEDAHQALINALLGVDKDGKIADFSGNNLKTLKADIDALTKDFWKFKIGGDGEFTIQQAVDSLNNRISSVNNAVEALIGTGFEGKTITEYITELKETLNSLSSSSSTALDNVKDSLVGVIGNVQTNIVKAVLGYEGTIEALDSLNLKALAVRVSAIEGVYVTEKRLQEAISSANTGYTKAEVDGLVNSIIGALCKKAGSDKADSLNYISGLVDDLIGALDKIGSASYTGSSITDAIATLQTSVSTLQTTVGDSDSGLVKDLADLVARVDQLEKDVASLTDIVQSIVYVPEYEDGMIYVDGVYNEDEPQVYDNPNRNIEVDFRVNTFRGYAFNPDNYSFKGYITSTKKPTKAYATESDGFEMTFLSFNKNILALQFNSREITDKAFWAGNAGASIAVEVIEERDDDEDGNSLTTEYIPLKLNGKTEVPGGEDDPQTPSVQFAVTPSVLNVSNAGGQIKTEVRTDKYWKITNDTNNQDGIIHFTQSNLSALTAQVSGTQIVNPYYPGTQTVTFYVPSYSGKTDKEYVVSFAEYNRLGTNNYQPTGKTATFTIKQLARDPQTLSTDPAGCINGITLEWNDNDTTFVVIPDDQRSDFSQVLNITEGASWVTLADPVNGDGGTKTLKLNITPREKNKAGYYGTRKAMLTLISGTGEEKNIPIEQLPHPAGDFSFFAGTEGDAVVDSLTQAGTGIANTFEYNAYGEDSKFTFRVDPSDELGDWTYDASGATSNYTVNVGSADANGVKLVTVYPNEHNADYDSTVEGSIVFTHADGITKRTLKFVQSKREASDFVDLAAISFTWDGKKTGSTEESISVAVQAEDGFNDWVVDSKPTWVKEFTNNNGIADIKVDDNNTGADRDSSVTFKNPNGSKSATLQISQSKRPDDQIPELKIILAGTDDAFDSKEFKWNAAKGSDSDKSVTFNVSSSFSGDDWVVDTTGFGPEFTLAEVPTKGTILKKDYSVTANAVNNDWENDIKRTITFTPKSATGEPVADKAVELTFKITKRGGEGSAPTVDIKSGSSATTGTTFDYKGNVKGTTSTTDYTFTVTSGTYSEDGWTYVGDKSFDDCFTLTETPANSGNFAVRVNRDSLDYKKHVGKLIFTPKSGEHAGTPVEMTFTIEEYVQNLTFKKITTLGTQGSDITAPATLDFGYAESSITYGAYIQALTAQSWENIIEISVNTNGDTEPWSASIDGDFEFLLSVARTGSWIAPTEPTVYQQTPNNNSGNQTIYIRTKDDNKSGETKTGHLTIKANSKEEYVFTLNQAALSQTLTFKNGSTTLTPGSSTLTLEAKSGSEYKVTVTPTPDVEGYTAYITNGGDYFSVTPNGKEFTIKTKTNNVGTDQSDRKTGKITFYAAGSTTPIVFDLEQKARAKTTYTPSIADKSWIFEKVVNTYSKSSYTGTFDPISIGITSTDTDWGVNSSVSVSGTSTATYSAAKDGNNVKLTTSDTRSSKSSAWTAQKFDVTITLTDWSGAETKYTYTIVQASVSNGSDNKSHTISFPGSTGLNVKGSFNPAAGKSNWSDETSGSKVKLNATVNSKTIIGSSRSIGTVTVVGTNSSSSGGTTTLTLNFTDSNSQAVGQPVTFTYTKSSSTYTLK